MGERVKELYNFIYDGEEQETLLLTRDQAAVLAWLRDNHCGEIEISRVETERPIEILAQDYEYEFGQV